MDYELFLSLSERDWKFRYHGARRRRAERLAEARGVIALSAMAKRREPLPAPRLLRPARHVRIPHHG